MGRFNNEPTPFTYFFNVHPYPALNHLYRKNRVLVSFFFLRNNAHIAGVKVRALNPEKATDVAMVNANCLYSSPVMPLINAVGIKTDNSTKTSPMTGPCNSCIAFSALCLGVSFPSCTSLAQSSTTTIASSTTMAMARTSPNKVRVLSENPKSFITANVAIRETGIAIIGIITALQL